MGNGLGYATFTPACAFPIIVVFPYCAFAAPLGLARVMNCGPTLYPSGVPFYQGSTILGLYT